MNYDREYYEARAEEWRALSVDFRDPYCKSLATRMAEGWERMAKQEAVREMMAKKKGG